MYPLVLFPLRQWKGGRITKFKGKCIFNLVDVARLIFWWIVKFHISTAYESTLVSAFPSLIGLFALFSAVTNWWGQGEWISLILRVPFLWLPVSLSILSNIYWPCEFTFMWIVHRCSLTIFIHSFIHLFSTPTLYFGYFLVRALWKFR